LSTGLYSSYCVDIGPLTKKKHLILIIITIKWNKRAHRTIQIHRTGAIPTGIPV